MIRRGSKLPDRPSASDQPPAVQMDIAQLSRPPGRGTAATRAAGDLLLSRDDDNFAVSAFHQVTAARRGVVRRIYEELIGHAGALRRFRAGSADTFAYLVSEFAFDPMTFEETGYGAVCSFENATTVVELHLDWREELIFVYVRPGAHSVDRARIGPPGVLLDAIMVYRGERPEKQVRVLKPELMLSTLREYARALRADAPEALRGDFRELTLVRTARPKPKWRVHKQGRT
jgi:hypothetical protein